ncbi:MAG TPA: phosphomannomutase/phosphoglucomutase [Cycloclasticus sp.]|nr:phosphomannomutase/phosphoglucomutase [Cycloclasticus sp.]HIL92277.1 phosphomannomutase/phosphoglucomutase [Cycloclasticus sp.]
MIKKIIPMLMLLVLALGGAGYVYLGQIEQQNIDEAEQLTARVQKVASALSLKVKKWRSSVTALAQDPALIDSLKENTQAVTAWVNSHHSSVDEMTKLRVVRPGLMQVDMTVSPPLGYAGLDLIRRAETSKKVQMPEVHMMSGDNRHIAIVAPVMDGEGSLAVVLASLNVDAIQKTFKSALAGEQGGWLLLKQGGLKIASGGASSHQSGAALGGIQVVGTRWKITIKKQAIAAPLSQGELMTYVVGSLIIIFILGMLISILGDQGKRKKLGQSLKKRKAKKNKEKPRVIDEGDALSEEEQLGEQAIADAVQANIQKKPEQAVNPIFMKDDAIEVETQMDVPQSIFRAYDIRGIVDETLTEAGVLSIGRAVATEALNAGQKTIVIARDGRLHSPRLSESLAKGIQSTGCHVIDVGQVPTPVLYFATHQLDTQSGVMITGSHNPANYNGLKIVIAGNTLSGDAIQNLYKRIERNDFEAGEGSYQEQVMLPEYIGAITADVRLGRMMKIVVDCGNGVAGEAAPMLLSTLGCDVVPLYCDIDGNFPNHHPDPSKPENLQELIDKVREEEAELGLAFDGDGDRLGVVDSSGNIIWPDRQMMLYAIDVLSRQAGADIIYDVKCTRNLAKVIAKHGGKPIMSKTGHSLIKAKMKETNAELAGEMSGHIFFKERWYGFDDALYTAARLLEIVTAEFRSATEIFAELPDSVSTPEINIALQEGENFSFVEELQSKSEFEDAKIITIDGIRVEFKNGWGLVRASNTTPSLVLRFEADDEVALEQIKALFKEQMLKVNPDIELPF